MTKEKTDILENIEQYSPEELVQKVLDGVVSFEELCSEPEFEHTARRSVKNLLQAAENDAWERAKEEDTTDSYDRYLNIFPDGEYADEANNAIVLLSEKEEWETVDKDDKAALRQYINEHPTSPYINAANECLRQLSRHQYRRSPIKRLLREVERETDYNVIVRKIKDYIATQGVRLEELLGEIKNNQNLFNSNVIVELENAGVFSFDDLEERAGVKNSFLDYIENDYSASAVLNIMPPPINSIMSKTTEVYFWGIPQSGKTCALGAILNETQYGEYVSVATPLKCQGYDYMNLLTNIFPHGDARRDSVVKLPIGTRAENIFVMSYAFERDKKIYPVTFIDLAGELIAAMYYKFAQRELDEKQKLGLQTAERLLSGNQGINRKMHFFVLEYNGHSKKYGDLSQDMLLTGAMKYIEQMEIFKRETDAIFLLVTKSDLIGSDRDMWEDEIKKYIKEHYLNFYNSLKSLCKKNEINHGDVPIIAFSLGEVCFRNLCLFDNKTADIVVRNVIDRAKGFSRGNKILEYIKKLAK